MKNRTWSLAAAGLLAALAGCEDNAVPAKTPEPPKPIASVAPPPIATTAPAGPDLLGPKPALAAPKPFEPPAPTVFQAANGLTVWLLERRSLPLVAATLVIPLGSAADPEGQEGLASVTANMLDEGAGSRDAVKLSTAVIDLGATLSTGAGTDGSFVSLSVLKKNFGAAFQIFGDVIARPRFDAKEWKRASALWKNDLEQRASDPPQVARLVTAAVLYGPDSPYGHPVEGRLDSAAKINLPQVKAFYAEAWRPDQATLVVAGDIGKAEVLAAIDAALGKWKAPKSLKMEPPAPPGARWVLPPLVLVDRPVGAPQTVLTVARPGVPARDPRLPLLDLINSALGGSFTSRLNQNLREEHGWTYGAASTFTETRGIGAFTARSAVVTEATGPALQQMLAELGKMASAGLSDEELGKVKAQDRAELVESYETVGGIARLLSRRALLGLPPDYDAAASRARQDATRARLAELAPAVDTKGATIVVVGAKGAVLPQLAALGLPAPEMWDAEGRPITTK